MGMSGWTGFAPLTLAKEAGIFKKNGVDVTIKKIPQKDRHLAIASGDVQCAATTVETWIVWNANGVATTQVVQLDKSYGADGMAVRNNIAKIADLKGKTVAASAPGHGALFHAGVDPQEERPVGEGRHGRQPRARGRRAGVRRRPERRGDDLRAVPVDACATSRDAGKIIATTLDYPMVMDTFGCTPKFLDDNPKAAQGDGRQLLRGLEMIKKEPKKSYEIMGARREADGRAVREVGGIPALAGQGGEPEVLRRRAPAVQQGGGGPAARGRHHQDDAGQSNVASSIPSSSSEATGRLRA